jgi:hypothetical protein
MLPRPALVVLLAAAFVAAGGVALARIPASNGTITACYAKNGGTVRIIDSSKKCARTEKKIAWNQAGKVGATGATGARGAAGAAGATGANGQNGTNGTNGTNGIDGANGSPAASMLQGHVNTTVTGTGEEFALPSGAEPAAGSGESAHSLVTPNATIVVRDLLVRLDDAASNPAAGVVYVFTLRDDGADTAVTCTMSNSARTCNSGDATATIAAGSQLALRNQQTGTPDGFVRGFSLAWRATTP